MTVIRAIDIGYGNTKYVKDHRRDRRIECGLFPSLAPMAVAMDFSEGVCGRRETVSVRVNGHNYEVGPDVDLLLGNEHARPLHQEFIETPEYLALLRGALTYMDVPEIDLLVVGLPVMLLAAKKRRVIELLKGHHVLSDNRSTYVKQVTVIAQPMGGFFDFALTSGLWERMRSQRNLIVDPGYFTLDWVLANGMHPIVTRCDSHAGGVSNVFKKIAQSISMAHKVNYNNLQEIDRALRFPPFVLYGREVQIKPFLDAARPAIDSALTALTNSVGDGRDIDNIILVGGGASLFSAALQARFQLHAVHIVPDPVYANVRGFQLAGVQLYNEKLAGAA